MTDDPKDKLVITLTNRCDELETLLAQERAKVEALKEQERDLRLHYSGAVGLLAQTAILMGNGYEQDETRDSIEQCLNDFCDRTPSFTYKRVLQRIELLPVQTTQ